MARLIIRYSFNGTSDATTATRTAVRNAFKEDVDYDSVGTASWEGAALDLAAVIEKLEGALDVMKGMPAGCSLDHLWIYVDESS